MATRYFGERIKRNEDPRLLTGQGLYVDVVDIEKALQDESPIIHEEIGSNVAAHVVQTKGNYESAKKDAALLIKRRFKYEHGCAAAIENRGMVAEWDRRAGRLTVWDTTQAPVVIRNGLAGMVGLSPRQVRVLAPFIGGGFGPKIMIVFQGEELGPWAAMKLK